MKEQNTPELQKVIDALELLHHVKPDATFRKRMERQLPTSLPPRRFAMQTFALRIAAVTFLILLSGSGMIAAATQSKPGEMLYPVKQMVESVRTHVIPKENFTGEPTPLPKEHELHPLNTTVTSTPTPPEAAINETLPPLQESSSLPSPTVTQTPTPTPVKQVLHEDTTVDTVVEIIPEVIHLPIGGAPEVTPTPTPPLIHEGSKDNGSNAGAGGSLLPKLLKNLPKAGGE